jgi:capsular polysaccharide biosynthesis protein
MTNVLAGLFVGFAAGLTLVLILHWRDEEWLLTRQAIEKSVSQPVLGRIRSH